MALPLVEFVDTRAPRWEELETLTLGAKGRVDRLAPDDVRRLGSLYRQATADLATARRRFPHDPVSERLDDLVRQSRPLVYGTVAERTSVLFFVTTSSSPSRCSSGRRWWWGPGRTPTRPALPRWPTCPR